MNVREMNVRESFARSRCQAPGAIRLLSTTIAITLAFGAVTSCDQTTSNDDSSSSPVVLQGAQSDTAKNSAAAAVDALISGGALATSTTGTVEGRSVTIEARLDPTAGNASLDEVVGEVTNEFVLLGEVLYVRIFGTANAGPDGGPPFTVLDVGEATTDFLWQPILGAGRIFGDPEVLSAVLRDAPAQVLSLGTRGDTAAPEQGYRFVFDSLDIGNLLIADGFEDVVMFPEPGADTTTIEIWIDEGGARQLSTSGSMYQDGELIDDVDLTITIDTLTSADITAPPNTAA